MPYKNRAENLAYMKKWHQRNRESQKLYIKEYQKSNRENLRIYTSKYRIKNPWLNSYTGAEQRCNNKNHHAYKNYGGHGIKFLLTKDETKTLWVRDRANLMKWPSIDRVDNDRHYEFKNCRFIEMGENSARRYR